MRFSDKLLDLLFPPRCAFCRKLLRESERGACRACRKKLPYVPEGTRKESIRHVRVCAAPLYYEGSVRDSLLRYKFHGVTAYKNIYAELLADCVRDSGIDCDMITWAPLSKRRLRKRGYDQARLVAETAAKLLDKPCVRTLEKIRDNPPQSSLDGAEKRRANAAGVYRCTQADKIKGKTMLIIDDIVTTGSTLSECAKVLKGAGAAEIYAAAVASAHR